MGEKILEFERVDKRFGEKNILFNVSFSVEKNEIFGIIGKSGAGKTTLLKMIIGYYKPDKGRILFLGKDFSRKIVDLRTKVGFVTQDDCFYDELSVLENLEYFGKMNNVSNKTIKSNAEQLLVFLQLEKNRHTLVKKLSGGMKRRLDFACAMMHNPEVIIMDEPTSGLDPILRKHFWTLIKYLKTMGKTIIFSSHMLEEVDSICDSVAIVDNGTVVASGKILDVRDKFSKNYEIHIETEPGDYERLIKRFEHDNISVSKHRINENKLVIFTPNPHDAMKDLMDILDYCGERIIDVDVEKPKLEEVFEFYVEDAKK